MADITKTTRAEEMELTGLGYIRWTLTGLSRAYSLGAAPARAEEAWLKMRSASWAQSSLPPSMPKHQYDHDTPQPGDAYRQLWGPTEDFTYRSAAGAVCYTFQYSEPGIASTLSGLSFLCCGDKYLECGATVLVWASPDKEPPPIDEMVEKCEKWGLRVGGDDNDGDDETKKLLVPKLVDDNGEVIAAPDRVETSQTVTFPETIQEFFGTGDDVPFNPTECNYLHIALLVHDYLAVRIGWSEGGALLSPETVKLKGTNLRRNVEYVPLYWENEQCLRGSDEKNTNFQFGEAKFYDRNNAVVSAGVSYAIYQPPLENVGCVWAPMKYSEYKMMEGQVDAYDTESGSKTMSWGFDALSMGNLAANTGIPMTGLSAGFAGSGPEVRKCFAGMTISQTRNSCVFGAFNKLQLNMTCNNPKGVEYALRLYTGGLVPAAAMSGNSSYGRTSLLLRGRQWVCARTLDPQRFPYTIAEELGTYNIPFVPLGATASPIKDSSSTTAGPKFEVSPSYEWIFSDRRIEDAGGVDAAVPMGFDLPDDFTYTPSRQTLVLVLAISNANSDLSETTFVTAHDGELKRA